MSRLVLVVFVLVLVAIPLAVLRPGGAAGDGASTPPATDPAALRPLAGERRLVVVLADNAGSETTDLLVPHGILARSGAVDVLIVATGDGPVKLMPALTIRPDMTVAAFEHAHPQGADAVIVPAFHSGGTPATSGFLRRQAALGAMIVAICEGAEPVARAGLLEERAATTHWFAQRRMARRYRETSWVRNARYVVDGPVMSSSGVSASVPATLALLEILAGMDTARATARGLGLEGWTDAHDSGRFALDLATIGVAASNRLGVWRHELVVAEVRDGFDGVAFALQADAWSRTYRSRLIARNAAGLAVSNEGVTLLTETGGRSDAVLTPAAGSPLAALDASLEAISRRYGRRTAAFVATQLEYGWPADVR